MQAFRRDRPRRRHRRRVCGVAILRRGKTVALVDRRGPGEETSLWQCRRRRARRLRADGLPADSSATLSATRLQPRAGEVHYSPGFLPTSRRGCWRCAGHAHRSVASAYAAAMAPLLARTVEEHSSSRRRRRGAARSSARPAVCGSIAARPGSSPASGVRRLARPIRRRPTRSCRRARCASSSRTWSRVSLVASCGARNLHIESRRRHQGLCDSSGARAAPSSSAMRERCAATARHGASRRGRRLSRSRRSPWWRSGPGRSTS